MELVVVEEEPSSVLEARVWELGSVLEVRVWELGSELEVQEL